MDTMLRRVVLVLFASFCCLAFVSCDVSEVKEEAPLSKDRPQGLLGAGATFPAALYKKWIEEYRNVQPEVGISYLAVGSGEGTDRFIRGEVDFGASDSAMSDAEMAEVDRGVQLIPTTAGSIVLAYNLPGVSGELRLSREVYVDIFLGKIERWNDKRLKSLNPDLSLPSSDISVAARLDGSGTTFAFTKHLSEISEQWRNRGPGAGKLVDWPGPTMLGRGNEGVAGIIKRTPGALGYVEYGIASRLGLQLAALENRDGAFVSPTGTSGMATLENAKLPENLRAFFPDPPGAESYPIVTYTWMLLYKKYDDADRSALLKQFVGWCLTEGQQFNEELGFIRLPSQVAKAASQALQTVQ